MYRTPTANMLEYFFEEQRKLVWKTTVHDCCMLLADWVMLLGYNDPAPSLRNSIETQEEAARYIESQGSLVDVVQSCCNTINLPTTTTLSLGVIGVIGSYKSVHRQWAAIWDGYNWRVRGCNGIVKMSANCLRAWEV